jgi:hypothetical protein
MNYPYDWWVSDSREKPASWWRPELLSFTNHGLSDLVRDRPDTKVVLLRRDSTPDRSTELWVITMEQCLEGSEGTGCIRLPHRLPPRSEETPDNRHRAGDHPTHPTTPASG